MMDQQKLRLLVFEKTGIKIDVTDPVFALVALNESLLEETLRRHMALIQEAGKHWQSQQPLTSRSTFEPHSNHADNWESDETLSATRQAGSNDTSATAEVTQNAFDAPNAPSMPPSPKVSNPSLPGVGTINRQWLILAASMAFGSAILTATLVLVGLALFWPSGISSTTQSTAQNAQLKQAEQRITKLQNALQKLDAKSQALIQSEIDKP
jgi:hypothetical protein